MTSNIEQIEWLIHISEKRIRTHHASIHLILVCLGNTIIVVEIIIYAIAFIFFSVVIAAIIVELIIQFFLFILQKLSESHNTTFFRSGLIKNWLLSYTPI